MPSLTQKFGALALIGLLPCLATAAANAGEENPAPFLTVSRESDDIERRAFDIFSAEFDLASPDLEIKALLAGASVQDLGQTEKAVDLENCLLAVGTGWSPEFDQEPALYSGLPACPLVCEGSWKVMPGHGFWSAVGFTADNHPVFSTNWLKEEKPAIVSMKIETGSGQARSDAKLNRGPDRSPISVLTGDFFRLPRQEFPLPQFLEPRVAVALLTERRTNPGRATKEIGGAGGEFPYSTLKIVKRDEHYIVGDGMVALMGFGDSASWIESHFFRNSAATLSIEPNPQWSRVRNAVGLGPPLIWEDRIVQKEDLEKDARFYWKDPDQPSRPVIAYFPRTHSLSICWWQTTKAPKVSISRKELIRQMIEKGARYVVELGRNTARAPIFLGEEWIAKDPEVSQSAATPLVLAFRDRSEEEDRLINLCGLKRTSARASGSSGAANGPSAAIDGRYGETAAMDNFWASDPADEDETWIQVEFDKPRKVWAIEVCHAEAVGFSPHFNTANFAIHGRKSRSGSWDELHLAEDNQDAWTFVEFKKPEQLRSIRVDISRPNSFESNPNARIAEILVWGE